MQVTNDDGAQTLDCTIQRRAHSSQGFADTTLPDLTGIAPLGDAVVDIDCAADIEVRIVGVASGAGLNCRISGRNIPMGWP